MEGAEANASNGGSGNIYIGQEIYKEENPTITYIPPCNFILPPYTLASPTTITLPVYTTSLEVAWSTVLTVTVGATETATSTITRTIQTTTISIPLIMTDRVNIWHWNITPTALSLRSYQLTSSILPSLIHITKSGVPSPNLPVTRILTLPPFPYKTDIINPSF
jgi:chitinase